MVRAVSIMTARVGPWRYADQDSLLGVEVLPDAVAARDNRASWRSTTSAVSTSASSRSFASPCSPLAAPACASGECSDDPCRGASTISISSALWINEIGTVWMTCLPVIASTCSRSSAMNCMLTDGNYFDPAFKSSWTSCQRVGFRAPGGLSWARPSIRQTVGRRRMRASTSTAVPSANALRGSTSRVPQHRRRSPASFSAAEGRRPRRPAPVRGGGVLRPACGTTFRRRTRSRGRPSR